MKNLWILTEERPKPEVIKSILELFCKDKKYTKRISNVKIKPLLKSNVFQFRYVVEGVTIQNIGEIIIINVSSGSEEGNKKTKGSFVDFLVFEQDTKPLPKVNAPLYAIEETKTSKKESRNVAVFQRLSKFVSLDYYDKMKNSKKIMLYSIRNDSETIPATFVFGIKALKTLGVHIMGLDDIDCEMYNKFNSLQEIIDFKNKIAANSRKGNVPLTINYDYKTKIGTITAKLLNGKSWSDPNIGSTTSLSSLIHKLEPDVKKIIIKDHKFPRSMKKKIENTENKFVKIATKLKMELDGFTLKKSSFDSQYWKYSDEGEKIVSIFLHLVLMYNNKQIIYENHAGAEQGYFYFPNGEKNSIPKDMLKPDLVFIDEKNKMIYVLEAEMSSNVFKKKSGVNQLSGFKNVISKYCSKWKGYSTQSKVILYGDKEIVEDKRIIFQLKKDGTVKYFNECPEIIKNCISNL